MINEEKAREIAIEIEKLSFLRGFGEEGIVIEELKNAALKMATWKEQQIIEKAIEWLEPVFKDLAGYYCGGDLINDFKKAMEE